MTRTLFPLTRTSLSTPLLEEFDKFFNEFVIFPRFLGHSVKFGCHSFQLK